jgi:glycosyltransferase involved in cell wall biosynthesis
MFPDADVFTLLHVPGMVSERIEGMRIHTSMIQHLPRAPLAYRFYLPLFPTVIEKFDLRGYDLILSSSHCVAKGVRTDPDTLHLCYCYTPMRYVWDMSHQYFNRPGTGTITRLIVPIFLNYLRMWDYYSSERVTHFVSISRHIARRIQKHYRRPADVIYPPVNSSQFRVGAGEGGYYLIVSAFAPYKRIDLAVEAFNRLGLPLVIVGIGQERKRLMHVARRNIEFTGWVSDAELADLYAGCKAFLFPAEEDFGIAPLEAQTSGRPVIAYGAGGVLETVKGLMLTGDAAADAGRLADEEFTGLFFPRQTADDIVHAVRFFERVQDRFDPEVVTQGVRRFDRAVFKRTFSEYIDDAVRSHRATWN